MFILFLSSYDFNTIRKAIKGRNILGLRRYLSKYGSKGNLTTCFFDYATACKDKTQLKNERKVASSPFTKKNNLGISKNCRGITFMAIAAKIYHALILNRIPPEFEKVCRKNSNGFW